MENSPISVTVSLGYTMNTGDYESLRFNFSVQDNARVNNGRAETVNEAFERVYGFVSGKLTEKLTEAKEAFNG